MEIYTSHNNISRSDESVQNSGVHNVTVNNNTDCAPHVTDINVTKAIYTKTLMGLV